MSSSETGTRERTARASMGCALVAALLAAGLLILADKPSVAQDAAAQNAAGGALPGGATSLNEGHGDWTVTCQAMAANAERPAQKACSLSQRQINAQGQNVFAVEMRATVQGAAGAMVLPFGLAVREPVVLKIDGTEAGKPLPFSTCLPAGCIVPLLLDAKLVASLKAGKTATITAPAAQGAPIELSLSLNGFANALARTAELAPPT